MTTVRVNCPNCGDLEFSINAIKIQECTDDMSVTYSYYCFRCRIIIVRPCGQTSAELLISSGAQKLTWHWPAELREHKSGKPLTNDDLLDFHQILYDDEAFVLAVQGIADTIDDEE